MNLLLKTKIISENIKICGFLHHQHIDVIVKNPEMEDLDEEDRLISDKQLGWLNQIRLNNELKKELE